MRRLSIIDIEGGHQPMFNRDRSIGAVLNGEIYNFRELRAQLEDRGYTFITRSDSEVAVYAYQEWGAQCVERFEGMFAIAVLDQRSEGSRQKAEDSAKEGAGTQHSALSTQHLGKLFLARDHLGIKPLYYSVQTPKSKGQGTGDRATHGVSDVAPATTFLFASEVRTLLASGLVPPRLSLEALESYLLFGSVGEPMTLIDGVFSLPPGHRMTIDFDQANPRVQPESYWNIACGGRIESERNGNAGNSVQRVRHLLEQSVRKHLIADVPVGVFLSSGIDSTALAALASKEAAGVHTFTVAFPEKEFSEADIARRTAATFGTTHKELMLSGDEMLARLSEAVNALDQPSMDGINTYFVSWGATQAGLKVALSGLGGDEVFGGYSNFRRTANFQRFAAIGGNVPRGLRSAMAAAVAGAGGHFVSRDAAQKLAAIWNGGDESLPDAFFFGRNLFTPSQVTRLLREQKRNGSPAAWRSWLIETASQARALDMFGAVTCMEARSYLVNTLLRDTDSMSMAHSLEVRVPFLDQPLVEFVTHLPQAEKTRKGIPKALLVESLSDLLPHEVVNQSKRGFTFPWAEWLRGPLKAQVEGGLSELSPALNEALDATETKSVWQDYLDGKTSWSRPWSLYVLNEWAKKHLDAEC
jgi:asparagine synthase (glutamine-hydrolysing)